MTEGGSNGRSNAEARQRQHQRLPGALAAACMRTKLPGALAAACMRTRGCQVPWLLVFMQLGAQAYGSQGIWQTGAHAAWCMNSQARVQGKRATKSSRPHFREGGVSARAGTEADPCAHPNYMQAHLAIDVGSAQLPAYMAFLCFLSNSGSGIRALVPVQRSTAQVQHRRQSKNHSARADPSPA